MIARGELWCYRFFSILGSCLILVAGYFYFAPPAGHALDVAETEVTLTGCAPGETRDVVFRVDNRSGKPMRVLGLADC